MKSDTELIVDRFYAALETAEQNGLVYEFLLTYFQDKEYDKEVDDINDALYEWDM